MMAALPELARLPNFGRPGETGDECRLAAIRGPGDEISAEPPEPDIGLDSAIAIAEGCGASECERMRPSWTGFNGTAPVARPWCGVLCSGRDPSGGLEKDDRFER
jgi:hypothetical protein